MPAACDRGWFSGKSGSFCNACHSGGATPTVTLAGPTTLQAGATGTYTFIIAGGAAVAGGLDAALDDGSLAAGAHLATVSASTQLLGGEVTHTMPVSFASGSRSLGRNESARRDIRSGSRAHPLRARFDDAGRRPWVRGAAGRWPVERRSLGRHAHPRRLRRRRPC